VPGFDQAAYSQSHVLCVGAGGIVSQIAPTLVRKGIGRITVLDDDIVEASNLNRQRFYRRDLGANKAIAFARNLLPECIVPTEIRGWAMRLEEAVARSIDLTCDVAVCGVDNNPARVLASRHFRSLGAPVIFVAVSNSADHGYVFVQEAKGPCIACLFPDMAGDDRYPCPGTPAVADILQAVGAFAVYAIDTLVTGRQRAWDYRSIYLAGSPADGNSRIPVRAACPLCA
jgi:molybdopterin/thiamine biosynthesis adenylyltransferase